MLNFKISEKYFNSICRRTFQELHFFQEGIRCWGVVGSESPLADSSACGESSNFTWVVGLADSSGLLQT